MKKASDLAIIETFFERMPQLFIQLYAFLYELSLKYENTMLSSLFETIPSLNATKTVEINETFQISYLITDMLPIFSMAASVLSSSRSMYTDYILSRKVFFLKNWMTLIIGKTSQDIPHSLFYYELSLLSKIGNFLIFGINILTRIIMMNVFFQLLILLPIFVIFKIFLGVLFATFNSLIFFRVSIDFFMRKNSEYNLAKKIINRLVQYFKFISYYPMIVFKNSQLKRFALSFCQFLIDLILIFVLVMINFFYATLEIQLLRIYMVLVFSSFIAYSVSNLIQYFLISNVEHNWANEANRQSKSIELTRLNSINHLDKEFLEMLIEHVV